MKPRHIVYINAVFAGLMIFSASMVYQFMTGNKPLDIVRNFGHHQKAQTITTDKCSNKAAIELKDAQSRPLQKLAVYQQACHSYATNTMMVFVSMPSDQTEAVTYAQADAKTLKDFAKHGIRPLVVAEPTSKAGNNLDFELFANGTYNTALDAYFTELKNQGLTDEQMGIWNPFPEANLPYWDNNQVAFFAPAVNNYLGILKAHFPGAHTSILLNSATYDTADFNWENGEYQSLLPYVKDIQPGLVEYAGIQGFPWVGKQGSAAAILNAAEFLNPDLLTEMADALHTKKIWFNTGTFGRKYTLDVADTVQMTPERRKSVINTIHTQAKALQKQGYDISVNIFAQDKSKTAEATDWSYWSNSQPFSSPAAPVITDFIGQLNDDKIAFWLFDN
ncbi:MAG TPA: hypothetical protein VFI74_05575 [Candidatus Saccharimonadales bacterium]|nr:hypothetical protein [Candidatus Saccharimonadales bacterium]